MLCYKTNDMLCYITHMMLCDKAHDRIFYVI